MIWCFALIDMKYVKYDGYMDFVYRDYLLNHWTNDDFSEHIRSGQENYLGSITLSFLRTLYFINLKTIRHYK